MRPAAHAMGSRKLLAFVCGDICAVITTNERCGDRASRSTYRLHGGLGCVAKIVSFASGKGGVGKSTTVSNLGLLLARSGMDVVAIDLDVGGARSHSCHRLRRRVGAP